MITLRFRYLKNIVVVVVVVQNIGYKKREVNAGCLTFKLFFIQHKQFISQLHLDIWRTMQLSSVSGCIKL